MVSLLLAIIYVSFISLGLPDAVLGAAWPIMYREFDVPISWMGTVAFIISVGTVISSLLSDRLNSRFSTGKVTAFSVVATAAAMIGFSLSNSYWSLVFWAIPYGLGAGAVDSSLNNYVAIHYASRHMSWLHCMWGLGAMVGPSVMGMVLTGGMRWNTGYLCIGAVQLVLSGFLFASLPLWKKTDGQMQQTHEILSVGQIMCIPGAKAVILAFFCYCALEQTFGQWAGSYLVMHAGFQKETAATLAGLFYAGITAGRFISGFLTMRFTDRQMVRMSFCIITAGILIMLLPFGPVFSVAGLFLVGLGCSPIYPCIMHATPEYFGQERSQAIIGVLMAGAYVGICIMPPLFGFIADYTGISVLPLLMAVVFIAMILSYESLHFKKNSEEPCS